MVQVQNFLEASADSLPARELGVKFSKLPSLRSTFAEQAALKVTEQAYAAYMHRGVLLTDRPDTAPFLGTTQWQWDDWIGCRSF